MKIAKLRAGAGMERDMVESIWDRYQAGGDLGQALKDELIQRGIDRFRVKIINAMRAAGLDFDEGAQLTRETITAAVSEKTGLDLTDLTPDAVAATVDARLSAELSAMLGATVSTVLDPEVLRSELVAHGVHAVQSGRATALMPAGTVRQIREVATWGRAGVPVDERRRVMANWYAKKYRRKHRQVWDR